MKTKELIKRYIEEIQFLNHRLYGIKYKKSEVVLNALQTEYINVLREIISALRIRKKEKLKDFVRDKELLKRHLIL
jgi:hypothetical protein